MVLFVCSYISRFDTIPACNDQMGQMHDDSIYCATIVSCRRGKNTGHEQGEIENDSFKPTQKFYTDQPCCNNNKKLTTLQKL